MRTQERALRRSAVPSHYRGCEAALVSHFVPDALPPRTVRVCGEVVHSAILNLGLWSDFARAVG